jgi:hypothetical protein
VGLDSPSFRVCAFVCVLDWGWGVVPILDGTPSKWNPSWVCGNPNGIQLGVRKSKWNPSWMCGNPNGIQVGCAAIQMNLVLDCPNWEVFASKIGCKISKILDAAHAQDPQFAQRGHRFSAMAADSVVRSLRGLTPRSSSEPSGCLPRHRLDALRERRSDPGRARAPDLRGG